MATTLFSDTTYSVQTLVDNITRGEIAFPTFSAHSCGRRRRSVTSSIP